MRCRRCWHVSFDDFITCPECGRTDRRAAFWAVVQTAAGTVAVIVLLVVWVVLFFRL